MRALLVACALVACAPVAEHVDEGRAASSEHRVQAPAWLLAHAGAGTWIDHAGVRHGWADARVANVRYDKRVLAEVIARYDDGATISTLHTAQYKGAIGGDERWGTDSIVIHDPGPNGARLSGDVLVRFRLQHDVEGRDEMVESDWARLYGDGTGTSPSRDPWAPGLDSPVRAEGPASAPEIRFGPLIRARWSCARSTRSSRPSRPIRRDGTRSTRRSSTSTIRGSSIG